MTHLRIHLVYLALLGFLTYQYWTKTQALNEAVGSIEQFDKLLKLDNEVVAKSSTMLLNSMNLKAQVFGGDFHSKARNLISKVWYINKWIEQQKQEFISLSGGFDKHDTTVLAKRFEVKSSPNFFTDSKNQEFQDSLIKLLTVLNDISDTNKYSQIKENYTLPRLLTNDKYWQSLKNKSATEIVTQLTSIQNRLELDMIPYLNYLFNQTSFCGKFDDFKLVVSPQKESIIEGETYKADLFIVDNLRHSDNEVTILANNKVIPIIGGVAHFEDKNLSVGSKMIKAIATIRQPLTGVVNSSEIQLEYRVFPKCSRDCK